MQVVHKSFRICETVESESKVFALDTKCLIYVKIGGGQLVVDTVRGMELGHAPAAMIDNLGIAIAR